MRLPFDEITDLAREQITQEILDELTDENLDEFEDEIEDLIIMAYALGWGLFLNEYDEQRALNQNSLTKALQTKIEGKTYKEYLEPHIEEKDLEGIYRVIDTTVHQMYVMAQDDCAKECGYNTKTWRTMEDNKVREAHVFLDKVKIPIDEKFYAGDDGALMPGGFSAPELNCNCRCILHYE